MNNSIVTLYRKAKIREIGWRKATGPSAFINPDLRYISCQNDSRAAECDIVKVAIGVVWLFCCITEFINLMNLPAASYSELAS